MKTKLHQLLCQTARSLTEAASTTNLKEIKTLSKAAHLYLENIDPAIWIACKASAPRYGIINSNAAESMNAALLNARGMGPLGMLQQTLEWMMREGGKRQLEVSTSRWSSVCNGFLTESLAAARTMTCTLNGHHVIVHRKGYPDHAVDLLNVACPCTCGFTAQYQIPCGELARAMTELQQAHLPSLSPSQINGLQLNYELWIGDHWACSAMRAAYSTPIPAVSTTDLIKDETVHSSAFWPIGNHSSKRYTSKGENLKGKRPHLPPSHAQ